MQPYPQGDTAIGLPVYQQQHQPIQQALYAAGDYRPYDNPSAAVAASTSHVLLEAAVAAFASRYEVNPKFVPYLASLSGYTTVLVCDDSGSMRELADPDVNECMTRWDELKMTVSIVIEAHAAVGAACDVYFINRGFFLNITHPGQLAQAFASPPYGRTNIVAVLNRVAQDHAFNLSPDGQPMIVHVFTDGHPTNANGQEDIGGLGTWLRNRRSPSKMFISIVLCTDDEWVDRAYRQFEYNPGVNRGIQGACPLDMTMHYLSSASSN